MSSKHDIDKKARSKSIGQRRLEGITERAPRFNSHGTPVAVMNDEGILAVNDSGVHFKPTRGRTLYSVAWEDVARMFKLEALAENPDAAIFKSDLMSRKIAPK